MKNRLAVSLTALLSAAALIIPAGCERTAPEEASAKTQVSETEASPETERETITPWTDAPMPEKGAAGSDAYAKIFAPLLEGLSWGMPTMEVADKIALSFDEAIQADGSVTIPSSMVQKVYGHDMTVWFKIEEDNNAGLFEVSLKFDPEAYTEIRDQMIRDFGIYRMDGDPEMSVFFQSRPLGDYYTKEELREIYLNVLSEEELTDERMDQLMDSSEFVFGVRSGGTLSLSARTYVTMKRNAGNTGKE